MNLISAESRPLYLKRAGILSEGNWKDRTLDLLDLGFVCRSFKHRPRTQGLGPSVLGVIPGAGTTLHTSAC